MKAPAIVTGLLCFLSLSIILAGGFKTIAEETDPVKFQPTSGESVTYYDGDYRGDASSGFDGEEYGLWGVVDNGVKYPYARLPAHPSRIIETQITHYGPPRFVPNEDTARCISIRECLELVDYYSELWGIEIDGFCAVHRNIGWWEHVRDEVPVLIEIQDHGLYLVLDRKGRYDCVGVDIYEPNQSGYMYSHSKMVWEITIGTI